MKVNIRMEAGSNELDGGSRVGITAWELKGQSVSQPLIHLQEVMPGEK